MASRVWRLGEAMDSVPPPPGSASGGIWLIGRILADGAAPKLDAVPN